jgi:hypothetical protein
MIALDPLPELISGALRLLMFSGHKGRREVVRKMPCFEECV